MSGMSEPLEWLREELPGVRIEEDAAGFCILRHPLGPGAARDPELSRYPGGALLFDLETLGFVGRPLFLIGLLVDGEEGPEVRQLFARDYDEEAAVVRAFIECAARVPLWVSFNGKSFDLPSLKLRAAYHRLRVPVPEEHRDLLFAARKLYRGVLPNCRLKTLESRVFGRHRHQDLDSAEIPAAYHAYVASAGGNRETMARILRHNRDDLVTLARLFVHLAEDTERTIGLPAPED